MAQFNNSILAYIPGDFQSKVEGNVVTFEVPANDIVSVCRALFCDHQCTLKTITAVDRSNDGGSFEILYVFGLPNEHFFLVPYVNLEKEEEFLSITSVVPQAAGHERKIKTFFGLEPLGHPNPARVLLHENWPKDIFPLRKSFDWQSRPKEEDPTFVMQKVAGEGIYEVPVGPIHAGIIEPGHFRFSMLGEEIMLLDPRLGYKHRGVEKLFEVLPLDKKIALSERVSGDMSFSHSLAFCQALEHLSEIEVPETARFSRVIFSELERLANHLNDIGFVMLDTGFSFGGSNCARLRETVMQWHERLSGNRYLRGLNTIGGLNKGISKEQRIALSQFLKDLSVDFEEVISIAEDSSSVLNRLEGAGKLDYNIAMDGGITGIAGRALGVNHDSRVEYPYAAYDKVTFKVPLEYEGDVYARLYVRIKEVRETFSILAQILSTFPQKNEVHNQVKPSFRKSSCAVGIAEGWRGDIVYLVVTDSKGNITRVEVRDPSFLNWPLVGAAGKGNMLPDFPLINKSFNLSYSGNDL